MSLAPAGSQHNTQQEELARQARDAQTAKVNEIAADLADIELDVEPVEPDTADEQLESE